ncbi:MAG TPA: CbiX/SirB N-terminal domain-containing protein [Myxococcaceae bacterium]|jgi:sirohydrochlorin ferrochelatase
MSGRRDPAVVIVGHGSRLPAVGADLARLARTVAAITGFPVVEPSGQADLTETLDRLALDASEILVQPYFLGMVGALALRLRERLERWADGHPAVRISLGEPLGDHTLVTAAIRDSALQCLAGSKGTVVVVGHGSPDPAWSQSLHVQVRRLEEAGGFERVIAVFLAHQTPRLEEALDRIDGEVAVVPFFLGRGLHTSVELPELLDARRERLHLARFWADDPRIARAVAGQLSLARPFPSTRGIRAPRPSQPRVRAVSRRG